MQEQKIDIAKIEKLRRRRAAKKRRVAVAAVIIAALAAAYLTGVYGASLAVLGDFVDDIAISINRGTGWPVPHTVSRLKSAEPFSGGALLLGDSDMVIYSPTGKLLRSIQHGYGYPAVSIGNKRACLYNRTGKELRIESRMRTMSTIITEQPIMLAEMASGGGFAVVTESLRFAAELTVYNSMYNPFFSWYSAEDTPVTIAIDSSASHVAAGCVKVENGGVSAVVYMFKTSSDEPLAQIKTPDALALMMEYLPNGDLMVLYDTHAAVYSGKDASEKARRSYNGQTLQTAEIESGAAALVFCSEAQEDVTELLVLDDMLEITAKADIGRIVSDIRLTKTNIFVVLQQSVLSYNFEGALLGEVLSTGKMFTVLNADKLLSLTDSELSVFEIPELPGKK